MLFNSAEYLFFFLGVLVVSWSTVGLPKLRLWFLLLASYYFYLSNNHWLILLIFASTGFDYVAGRVIDAAEDASWRKLWVALSIVINLSPLAYFKYANFFAHSARGAAQVFGIELSWVDLNVALPVGISFYTFESMSYTIDVYRRQRPAERSWQRYAFFIAFFPKLIAGPIVRASDFLPQLEHPPKLDVATLDRNLFRIFKGLVKKIVLADFLAQYADAAFDHPGSVDSLSAWLGVYAFALQIYFDFSGYTDIALGSARLIGYRLPENFERPYLAVSVTEFWRRWHMSLSTWLRDYLYISLGGNRMPTELGVYRNLMLTMVLGGLWHGAAWHFVIWGTIHGFLLAFERWRRGRSPRLGEAAAVATPHRILRAAAMFQLSVLLWIPFRAESVGTAGALLGKLVAFEAPEVVTVGMLLVVAIVSAAWLAQVFDEYVGTLDSQAAIPVLLKGLAYGVLFAAIVVMNSAGAQPFIYFQF